MKMATSRQCVASIRRKQIIIRDVVPLLEVANVQRAYTLLGTVLLAPAVRTFWRLLMLVTLRWCRYDNKREVPAGYEEDYVATGDPMDWPAPTTRRCC